MVGLDRHTTLVNSKGGKNMSKENNDNPNDEPTTTEEVEATKEVKIRPIESYHESVQDLNTEATTTLSEKAFKNNRHVQQVVWNTEEVLGCTDLKKITQIYTACMNHVNYVDIERLNEQKRSRGQTSTLTDEQQVIRNDNTNQTNLIIGYIVDGLASQEPPATVDKMKRSGVRETTEQQNHNVATLTKAVMAMVEGANPLPEAKQE